MNSIYTKNNIKRYLTRNTHEALLNGYQAAKEVHTALAHMTSSNTLLY